MTGLGETTAMLVRLRKASPLASGPGDVALTRTEDFGSNPGQLTMLSYRPERLPLKAPLVVVLHGCTQSAEAYAVNAGWTALADRFGFMVLAPQQSASNNPNRCFNWFSPADVRRGEGEAASIAAMVSHAVRTHDLDANRVFITGLSAGGAMAAAMLAVYPDLFAGGAVIAGIPYGVAANVQQAMGVMGRADGRSQTALGALVPRRTDGGDFPRLTIWHGDADGVVRAGNADDIAQQWTALHGLPSAPHRVQPLPFGLRSIWCSADGDTALELNVVRGLGHGTPLSTKGPHDVGKVAPYMLEAGVSSSLEIARFWKIDAPRAAGDVSPSRSLEPAPTPAPDPIEPASLGQEVMKALGQVPPSVQDVIAKALRGAGLLK
ncbi:extracellular catalytic domain type 1 short-chain-length polyhydroxyalkanoate depolymerase [Caulobacter segnis]